MQYSTFAGETIDQSTFKVIIFNICLHKLSQRTREGFLTKNIVAVSFFQNCATHQYSLYMYISFLLNEIIQA